LDDRAHADNVADSNQRSAVSNQQSAISNQLNPFTAKDAKAVKEEGILDFRSLCELCRPLRSGFFG
jgi:hypothetical protein